jgi:tRNA isopentenyl-2-thiomethyl-A-37 hydroxylase MiaE
MPASSSGERLLALADHLDSDLAHQLRRLAAADSEAHRYLEVVARAEFAEDLVKELRRHVASLERQLERSKAREAGSRRGS